MIKEWPLKDTWFGRGGMLFALIAGWVVDHYSYEPAFVGFSLHPSITTGIIWFALGPLGAERSVDSGKGPPVD